MNMQKIWAFTLAEVLITLGIIGIVAAMTIPSLMTKYRKSIVETRLKDSYSIFANAIRLAESAYGTGFEPTEGISGTGWNRRNAKAVFDNYFRPFMKINYEYSDNACKELSKAYGGKSNSQMYSDNAGACYNLMNGTSFLFFTGRVNSSSPFMMAVQLRLAPTKKRQIDGIDVFEFNIVNNAEKGLELLPGTVSAGVNLSNENLAKYCNSTSARVKVNNIDYSRSAFCLELIKRNGWKIPANYPLKF